MGIFGNINTDTITEEVETATNENNPDNNWGHIINICDKAGKSSEEAKNYLRAITKRLFNTDPHIAIQAVTLLDACIKNCGRTFHIEVASREFENVFTKLMSKAHPTVSAKLRESLKKWAENEFKTDQQLNLIPSLYSKLKNSGYDFASTEMQTKKSAPVSKDPNVVESQEEEEQILQAIELSLRETSSSNSPKSSSSLYPTANLASSSATVPIEPKKVRALYDFEAAEDNELTFSAGEILFVIDDSDVNWWKGSNQRGEGLFPANFVTKNLNVEPEKFLLEKAKKSVQFKETVDVKELKKEPEQIEINEEKINRLLHLLHEADPTNPERDTEEMLKLEGEVDGMGPLIDTELERVDRKHAQLTQLSADLVDALSLYHTLMREPQQQFPPIKLPFGYPNSQPSLAYNGNMAPNMSHPMMTMPQQHDRPPHFAGPSIQQQPQLPPQQFHLPPYGPPPGGMHPIPMHGVPVIHDPNIQNANLRNYACYPPNMAPGGPMGPQTVLDNSIPPQQQQQQQGPPFAPPTLNNLHPK